MRESKLESVDRAGGMVWVVRTYVRGRARLGRSVRNKEREENMAKIHAVRERVDDDIFASEKRLVIHDLWFCPGESEQGRSRVMRMHAVMVMLG